MDSQEYTPAANKLALEACNCGPASRTREENNQERMTPRKLMTEGLTGEDVGNALGSTEENEMSCEESTLPDVADSEIFHESVSQSSEVAENKDDFDKKVSVNGAEPLLVMHKQLSPSARCKCL